jgi:hypothetical protein
MENEVYYKVQEKRVALDKFDTRIEDVKLMVVAKQRLLAKLEAERELKAAALANMEEINTDTQRMVDRINVLVEREREIVNHYLSIPWSVDLPADQKLQNDDELKELRGEMEILRAGVKTNFAKSKQVFYGKAKNNA